MVCFVNVESVDRIIYSIFQRFNLDWKNRTLRFLHKRLDITGSLLRPLTQTAYTQVK